MTELNYKTFGEGMPVIFLHGLFGMLDNWQTFAKKMADEGYMVFLLDQRDHGKSPHTEAFTYELLSEDLANFLNTQWIHKAIIIGHSMGGKTALTFARDHEDVVEKLILIDVAPKKYNGGHESIFQALLGIDLQSFDDRNEIYDHLKKQISDEGTLLFLMKNISRKKEGSFEYKMNLKLLHENYPNIMSEVSFNHPVDVPTLFVAGGQSDYILPEDTEKIKEVFTDVQFAVIDGASHWVHADKPNELFDVVMKFIRE
ncbi:MAG: alpha/beta fold hydrolase [Saprospiraceae bacterium]